MSTPTTNQERYLVAAFRKLPAREQMKLLRQAKQAMATKRPAS